MIDLGEWWSNIIDRVDLYRSAMKPSSSEHIMGHVMLYIGIPGQKQVGGTTICPRWFLRSGEASTVKHG